MANIGKVLNDEIARIAQREAEQAIKALNLTTAALQKDLAALRQELTKKAAPAPAAKAKAPAKQKLGVKPAKTPSKGKKLAPKTVKATPAAEAAVSVEAAGQEVVFTAAGVKDLRKRLGLSQPAFAKLCGVSINTVSRWESSKKSRITSRPETLAALAKVQADAAGA